ncbi:MAG: hypothetical protein E7261_11225 [Lachnospiraceae bacterium]|nr:hypothetical protein [Lachnospiraceae bacterium]
MTVEQLIYSVNEIDDCYINEYAEAASVKKNNSFWVEIIGFACLVLVFCIPALLIPKSGAEYFEVETHSFTSYAEMCELLPEGHILSNIPDAKSARIRSEGGCKEAVTDFSELENYIYLRTYVIYEDSAVNISYTKDTEKTAESAFNSFVYADKEINRTIINGVEVLYCYLDGTGNGFINTPSSHWVVRFSVDNDLYELELYSFDEERMLDYIGRIMEQ